MTTAAQLLVASPLEVYGEDLRAAAAGPAAPTWLRAADGSRLALDLERWTATAAGADDELLARCASATLDVGCGPGRLTRALVARGIDCLGVDVAPVAVDLARTGGMPVLHASAFDRVLDDSRWATVLLADGNIGIGGDPTRLLTRCRHLLAGSGRVLVELEGPAVRSRTVRVRLESGGSGRASSWFDWAHVSVRDIGGLCAPAGLRVGEVWQEAGRCFAELEGAR